MERIYTEAELTRPYMDTDGNFIVASLPLDQLGYTPDERDVLVIFRDPETTFEYGCPPDSCAYRGNKSQELDQLVGVRVKVNEELNQSGEFDLERAKAEGRYQSLIRAIWDQATKGKSATFEQALQVFAWKDNWSFERLEKDNEDGTPQHRWVWRGIFKPPYEFAQHSLIAKILPDQKK